MEAHCIALELKYQNQSSKSGQHGQFSKVKSKETKIKHNIDVIETINIELEHSVAKLLAENEHLHKENEHLKQTYKDLYDSIKKTRFQTKDHNDSLIIQLNNKSTENADLKAQIQEKVFAITALKNELRKLKGNRREYAFAKLHHVIASSESRNSSKNMPRFSSNDMVHNHYLDEPKKKTQERDRNSTSRVMHSARLQNTTNGSKPKPRSNNQTSRSLPTSKNSCVTITTVPKADHSKNSSSFLDSKHFVCCTCHKSVFDANHDPCIRKFLKEVEFSNPLVLGGFLQECYSILAWARLTANPPHGSNVDISKIHKCKQTQDLSASTLINVQKEQSVDLSAGTSYNVNKDNLRVWLLKNLISQKPVS
ncbi:hypothetical protein Tco_1325236 [Tanacetum coccineum]